MLYSPLLTKERGRGEVIKIKLNIMEFEIVNLEPKTALSIRDTCTFEELPQKFGELYGEIADYAKNNSITFAGYPYGVYHSFSPEKIDLEAGIPAAGELAGAGRIVSTRTYSGKAAKAVHIGPYEKLNEAWGVFAKEVDKEYKPAGPCFEVYVTDPGEEPDSSKWITELYTPVE